MPKYGVHQIVLSRAIERCSDSSVNGILSDNREMAMLGAIGPDLFFWAPDYEACSAFRDIYDAIHIMAKTYNDIVGPFKEPLEMTAAEIESELGGLFDNTADIIRLYKDEIDKTKNLFTSAITIGALSSALGGVNMMTNMAGLNNALEAIFELFIPPRQNNPAKKEAAWYWFDMLHYRNTGDFAKHLVENSNSSDIGKAYALGYLSHIATDLTGHPYVNQIVGGPFRLHTQRHTLVENFIDCRMFVEEYDANINTELIKKLEVDIINVFKEKPKPLSGEVIVLLSSAFINTYGNSTCPALLTETQINESYENFQIVLNFMHDAAITRPIEPFSDVGKILSDAIEDLMQTPPPPQPDNPFTGGVELSLQGVEKFFKNIDVFLQWLGDMIKWLSEILIDLLDLIMVAALLPFTTVIALLYGAQLTLYEIYRYVRWPLVLGGVLSPDPEDLITNSQLFTTTFQNCVPDLHELYPIRKDANRNHLQCPSDSLIEAPSTIPAYFPIGSLHVTPYDFIGRKGDTIDYEPAILSAYAQAQNPTQTRALNLKEFGIGSAIDLATFMIRNCEGTVANSAIFANFDLDADRGHLQKTWDGTIGTNVSNVGDYL